MSSFIRHRTVSCFPFLLLHLHSPVYAMLFFFLPVSFQWRLNTVYEVIFNAPATAVQFLVIFYKVHKLWWLNDVSLDLCICSEVYCMSTCNHHKTDFYHDASKDKKLWTILICSLPWIYLNVSFPSLFQRVYILQVPPSFEMRLQALSLDRMASLYTKCFA